VGYLPSSLHILRFYTKQLFMILYLTKGSS